MISEYDRVRLPKRFRHMRITGVNQTLCRGNSWLRPGNRRRTRRCQDPAPRESLRDYAQSSHRLAEQENRLIYIYKKKSF